jgi:hypothetical protein
MSLVEEYHAAHKERLSRLSPVSQTVVIVEPKVRPYPFNAGWDGMWFYDLICPKEHPKKSYQIRDIQDAVCDFYSIHFADLISARRTADIVRPRQVAMYLCKVLTPRSLPAIGRMFGDRDHTTVLHATRKIVNKVQSDQALRDAVGEIRRRLG